MCFPRFSQMQYWKSPASGLIIARKFGETLLGQSDAEKSIGASKSLRTELRFETFRIFQKMFLYDFLYKTIHFPTYFHVFVIIWKTGMRYDDVGRYPCRSVRLLPLYKIQTFKKRKNITYAQRRLQPVCARASRNFFHLQMNCVNIQARRWNALCNCQLRLSESVADECRFG